MPPHDADLLRRLLAEAARLTGRRCGRIYVREGDRLRLRATLGPATGGPGGAEFVTDVDRLDATLSAGRTVAVVGTDPVAALVAPGGVGGVLLAGLRGADQSLVGVIALADGAGAGQRASAEAAFDPGLLAFLAVAAAAVAEWQAASDLAQRHEKLVNKHRSLRAGVSIERSFGRLVGGPGGVADLIALCATLTGKVVVAWGADHRVIATAGRPLRSTVALPAVGDLLAAAAPVASGVPVEVPARPLDGIARRCVLGAIGAGDDTSGWLAVLEHPSGLRPIDTLVVRLASHYVARELAVQRRVADVAWSARASLARQLVKGTNDLDDLRTSGEYLGVRTEARRVLIYAVGPAVLAASAADVHRFGDDLALRLGVEVLVTRGSEGAMLLVEAPPAVRPVDFVSMVKAALRTRSSGAPWLDLTAGVSSVCEPRDLARAYREAREVAQCIDRFAASARNHVLAVDDLGPARLFVANGAVSAVRAYVHDVLGALLTGAPGTGDLIATLGRYFDSGRSVRAAAGHLGVHENTVRLRLARILAATGLDVAGDANDQLSAQTALLVLRLQGHPALPSFTAAAAAQRSA